MNLPDQAYSSIKMMAARYIEERQLEDGGYFFARVPPSSGLDTYHAVKSLSLLNMKPKRIEGVANFILRDFKAGTLTSLSALFISIEVLEELGRISDDLRSYAYQKVMGFQNKAGGFGALDHIYYEVVSELEQTYRAVKVLKTIEADFDQIKIIDFVQRKLNKDGGYGGKERSSLASTFYATAIYKLLRDDITDLAITLDFLRKKEAGWHVHFIEDLYWLIMALANLGEDTKLIQRVERFVERCQRPNGGFSRSPIIGIPTLEYTYHALSILNELC